MRTRSRTAVDVIVSDTADNSAFHMKMYIIDHTNHFPLATPNVIAT
jgi:hypothetical protein